MEEIKKYCDDNKIELISDNPVSILLWAVEYRNLGLIDFCLSRGIRTSGYETCYDVLFCSMQSTMESLEETLKVVDLLERYNVEKFVSVKPEICYISLVSHLEKPVSWVEPKSIDEIKNPILIRFPGHGDNCSDNDGFVEEFFWIDKTEFEKMGKIIEQLQDHEKSDLKIEKDCSNGGHGCIISIDLAEAYEVCQIVPGNMDQVTKQYFFNISSYNFWEALRENLPDYYFTSTDHREPLLKLQEVVNQCICAYERFCCSHSHVEIGERIEI